VFSGHSGPYVKDAVPDNEPLFFRAGNRVNPNVSAFSNCRSLPG
jgi:hypothetical protein